jgi:tetratricopeptide (TPR) repeat protein
VCFLVTSLACSSQGWEEYTEAGYEAHQSGRLLEAEEMFLVAVQYTEGLYRQALEIRSQILGPQHQRVAVGLDNLGRFYAEQGSYAAAEPLYWRALEISEVNLGPDHPDVATTVGALAALYHDQFDYANAEPLHRRALRIREQSLGPIDIGVAEILEGMLASSNTPVGSARLWRCRRGRYHESGIRLFVRDTGEGIPEAALERIFDRLYRVNTSRGGYGGPRFGLALSITRRIAEAHDAELSATSRVGEGSEFSVEFSNRAA